MKKTFTSFVIASLLIGVSISNTNAQMIITVAGDGTAGYTTGAATASQLNKPSGVAVDGSGNIYIADTYNQVVRRVDHSTGMITTIAGSNSGGAGYTGDGVAATTSLLNYPTGVALDGAGNVYIADAFNNRIRMVNTAGIISTFAGGGALVLVNDTPATAVALWNPSGIAVDTAGNVYIADNLHAVVSKVNTAGRISTFAGFGLAGWAGDGAAASAAQLDLPYGIAVDRAGNVYVADEGNQDIRKINTSGIISTIAGNIAAGVYGYTSDGGLADTTTLNFPTGVAVDTAGNVYIADSTNNRIRMINSAGIITTFAGNGTAGYSGDGGAPAMAEINKPAGVATDPSGHVYIGDEGNSRVRKVTPAPEAVSANSAAAREDIILYPNPATGMITIALVGTGNNISASLLDMTGKVLLAKDNLANTANKTISFQTQDLASGTYIVTVSIDGKVHSNKVLVAHE